MPIKHQGIVITQTPFRISFFGGGTDFPDYFNRSPSTVIGTAIDKYLYVTLNSLDRFFDKRIRLSYAKLECVDNQKDLEHPIIRSILENHSIADEQAFLDIHTYADLPHSSGVGSSSSLAVGMLNALYLLNGFYKTSETIAKEAISIEREKLKEPGGWQDQIFAAFGGFNKISFANNHFRVEPICITNKMRQTLEQSCLFFFTGDLRSSANIQQSAIQLDSKATNEYRDEIQALAEQAFQVLANAASPIELIHEFGLLLHQSWQMKRNLSPVVSSNKIDQIYDIAMKAGAIGGKLCGAGGGGFLLFIVPEARQAAVIQALKDYKQLNIAFENHGSRAIYSKTYNPIITTKVAKELNFIK